MFGKNVKCSFDCYCNQVWVWWLTWGRREGQVSALRVCQSPPHDWRLGWSSPLKLRPCLLFQSRSPRNNNNFSILLSVTLQCHGIFNYLVNLSKVRPTLSRGIFVSVSAVTKEGAEHTGGQHSYQWCWDNVSSVGSIIQSGVRWWPNTSLYSITS